MRKNKAKKNRRSRRRRKNRRRRRRRRKKRRRKNREEEEEEKKEVETPSDSLQSVSTSKSLEETHSASMCPWGFTKSKPTGEAVTLRICSAPWPSLLWEQTGKLWVTKAVRLRSRNSRAAPEDPQHLIAQTHFQLSDTITENKTPRAASATTALPGQLQLLQSCRLTTFPPLSQAPTAITTGKH